MTESFPEGFAGAAVEARIRKPGRLDLALVVGERAFPATALWTRNLVQAAPILVNKQHLLTTGNQVRAILVNSGCANAATGEQGLANARRCAELVARSVGCQPEEVLLFSTGVIGAQLPMERIEAALPALARGRSRDALPLLNRAMMTTDTREKRAARSLTTGAGPVTLVGTAKGAGMIRPDMATMLAFLFTDAVTTADMATFLRAAADQSFNSLTVDGDTSTNDSVLLWSSARRKLSGNVDEQAFLTALEGVGTDLAKAIARDGEGATKLITVRVTGAPSAVDARQVAHVIAESPLVKTAVHGCDPNWGRILAAAGRAGIQFEPNQATVWVGDHVVYDAAGPHPENEDGAHRHLLGEQVVLRIDLARGRGEAHCFTCDFSAEYVKVNASYRS